MPKREVKITAIEPIDPTGRVCTVTYSVGGKVGTARAWATGPNQAPAFMEGEICEVEFERRNRTTGPETWMRRPGSDDLQELRKDAITFAQKVVSAAISLEVANAAATSCPCDVNRIAAYATDLAEVLEATHETIYQALATRDSSGVRP